MNCQEFREKHGAFVDDTLPGVDMERMHEHLEACCHCARHDTAVRRGLLVVRNLPAIQPSPDFMARLNARIHQLESASPAAREPRPASFGMFATLAAGIALATWVAIEATTRLGAPAEMRLAPVVASIPEPLPAPATSPAFVASVSTGMPVWPAVLMLDQVQMHLANLELQGAR